MVDLALLQSVSYIAGALGVGVAAIYYVMTLRVTQRSMKNTLETRQIQMFMNIYSQFWGREFQRQWNDMMNWEYRDLDARLFRFLSSPGKAA